MNLFRVVELLWLMFISIGAYQDILKAIVVPREVYWARRIRHAIAGLGTDDTLLRRYVLFIIAC